MRFRGNSDRASAIVIPQRPIRQGIEPANERMDIPSILVCDRAGCSIGDRTSAITQLLTLETL